MARTLFFLGSVIAFIGSAYLLVSNPSGSEAPLSETCEGSDCFSVEQRLTKSEDVSKAAAITSPPPCPYCGQDPNRWAAQTSVKPPEIDTKNAALLEGSCGALIYGLNQDQRRPPASLVKIATAMAVSSLGRLDDRAQININGWDLAAEDGSSIMGLEAGMSLTVEELLYGLLLPSGNDAALALAEHLGGSARVVSLMNQNVQRLGLHNTQFTNVDGRHNPDLYSTAFDMAYLGREMMADQKLKQIAGTQKFRPNWNGTELWNGNYLHYIFPGTIGVKTGYTEEAGSTIVAAVERDGRTLYAAVLGSWDAYWDAMRLFNWAFANTRSTCSGTS